MIQDNLSIHVQPGTYVVAVSGGVDSVVLLDLLRKKENLKLIVAHFDHGIRSDSAIDRELVQNLAKSHGLSFVYHDGHLGPAASEDVARKARYEFLHTVREAAGARAVITAHHHDDLIETAVINLLRGTNRKGLTALKSRELVHRPLLGFEKQQLRDYARDQGLVWREDSTNRNPRYLRNRVRHNLLPKLAPEDKQKLQDIVRTMHQVNDEIDINLINYLHIQPASDRLDRKAFISLPHIVAREVMASWLRKHGVNAFDQKILERLVVASKTFRTGGIVHVNKDYILQVAKQYLALVRPDR